MEYCHCNFWLIIEYITKIFTLLALLGAFGATIIYIYSKFAPIILLDIQYDLNKETGHVILKIRIENKSKVRVKKKDFILHILEYDADRKSLSEWVPQKQEDIEQGEEPNKMNDPIKFMDKGTRFFYPGEYTTIDYLTTCPKGKLLHVLLQFKSKYRNFIESWAITRIIINE